MMDLIISMNKLRADLDQEQVHNDDDYYLSILGMVVDNIGLIVCGMDFN